MKAVWLASSEKLSPLEVTSLGPEVVVASVKRAGVLQEAPLTGASPDGEVVEVQASTVVGKLCERTRPESTSSRKPSQEVASQPADTKTRPEA